MFQNLTVDTSYINGNSYINESEILMSVILMKLSYINEVKIMNTI